LVEVKPAGLSSPASKGVARSPDSSGRARAAATGASNARSRAGTSTWAETGVGAAGAAAGGAAQRSGEALLAPVDAESEDGGRERAGPGVEGGPARHRVGVRMRCMWS